MENDRGSSDASAFEREAQARRASLPAEFWQFVVHNKKWWLIPILMVLFLFGVLMLLGSTAAAPFIYTLF
jgi:hypothetical protein